MIPALARCAHRRDLHGNESWHGISAQSTLARLSTPSEQKAVSHLVPAHDAADRLASLKCLVDKANLLVVTPSPPTLGAQHIDLHSPRDLKARLRSNPRAASQTTQVGRRRDAKKSKERQLITISQTCSSVTLVTLRSAALQGA